MSSLFPVPPGPSAGTPFALRDYQIEAVTAIRATIAGGTARCLVVMPTGCGKTAIAAEVIRGRVADGGRCLVIAHRGELLEQFQIALDRLDVPAGWEMGLQQARIGLGRGEYRVVLASKDSLHAKRLAEWPKAAFDLIVVDEAHHVIAPTYRRILAHFDAAAVVGVTATPDRGDGEAVAAALPTLAFEYPLETAIHAGWLVRPVFYQPPTAINLSRVRTTAGDLNLGDLEDEIARHIEELVNLTKTYSGDRPTLAFTPDVVTAIAFAEGLRQIGVQAKSVHGTSVDRALVAAEFRDGRVQSVANCALWTEGFDAPNCSALALARKTLSRPLYAQMVGRALRVSPGKVDAKIIDFGCMSGDHDLVGPMDLFDTTGTDEGVLAKAREFIRSGVEGDPLAAVERARRVTEEELIARQRRAMSITVHERVSKYKLLAFDPFEVGAVLGVPTRGQPSARGPGRKHLARLRAYKFDDRISSTMTPHQAKRLIRELDRRRTEGLATHRQVSCLIANGLEPAVARTTSFADASRRLDAIFRRRA